MISLKKIFLLILILLTIKSTLYSFNLHLIEPIKFSLSNSYYTYKLMHYNYTQYIPIDVFVIYSAKSSTIVHDFVVAPGTKDTFQFGFLGIPA